MKRTPKTSLLRLQASPTCNLNCSYCYIPEAVRRQRGTMTFEVLDRAVGGLTEDDLLDDRLAISWHGAEPLAVGLGWYEEAFARVRSLVPQSTKVTHIFQSNGVLISDAWCDFIERTDSRIGVSIDGPEEQNRARVNWAGRPAFDMTMRGVAKLNDAAIPWTLLTVVTSESMRDPDSFIEFVRSTRCAALGFKVEETNVANFSTLAGETEAQSLYAEFVRQLWRAFPEDGAIRVREFDEFRAARRTRGRTIPVTLIPLRNITVAVNGDFTIFSGELLFQDDSTFAFGNVLTDSYLNALTSERFRNMTTEIRRGVQKCAESCPFYDVCGSFFISQKHAEFGTFDAGETLACKFEIKTLFDTLDQVVASDSLAPH